MRTILRAAVVIILFTNVNAAENSGDAILNETFSSTTVPANWKTGGRRDSFAIVDGHLQGTATADDSHGPSIGVPISGHDLRLEFDFKLTTPGYFLCLIDGDSQFKGQAHLLRFAATGRQVQVMQDRGDPESKRLQKIERDQRGGKRIPPTASQLAEPSFYRIEKLANQTGSCADGQWHHVAITLRKNTVTAQLDDKPPMEATGTVLDVRKSRLVFLVGQAGTIALDNVVVEAVQQE